MSAELWSEVVQSRWRLCCRRWEMEVCGLTFAQMFCHNPFPVLISFRTEDRWRVRSERKLSLQLSPHCSSAGGLSLFFIIDNTTRPINNNMNHTALSAPRRSTDPPCWKSTLEYLAVPPITGPVSHNAAGPFPALLPT